MGRFGAALDNFLIIVIGVVIVLLLVMLFGGKNSPVRQRLSALLVQDPNPQGRNKLEYNKEYYRTGEMTMSRPGFGHKKAKTVIAVLMQKVDERRRTVDPNGQSHLYNEYYELIFKTRRGDILHLVTGKQAFMNTPFHQQGQLTYQGDRMVSFEYNDGMVEER